MVGKRPSGTLATSKPIAKSSASASGRPATVVPSPKEHQAGADGHERNEPGGPVHLLLQGAYLPP